MDSTEAIRSVRNRTEYVLAGKGFNRAIKTHTYPTIGNKIKSRDLIHFFSKSKKRGMSEPRIAGRNEKECFGECQTTR